MTAARPTNAARTSNPEREARTAEAAAFQRRAADPAASVWVTASAGTGKTKVLTDRVLSLMLAGTPPQKILCLTFTKAAAAEMAQRLAKELATWVAMDDADLSARLENLTGEPPKPQTLTRARALFARVLDTPGGMKIQTIHAFCQAVLARFPLEAGIAPHAQVLDDRSASEMLQAAREDVLARAGSGSAPELSEALDVLTAQVGEDDFGALVGALIRERGRLTRLLQHWQGPEPLSRGVAEALAVRPEETVAWLRDAVCADAAFDAEGLCEALNAILERGTANERERAAALDEWLVVPAAQRPSVLDRYCKLFLTLEGQPRKTLLTKAAKLVPGALEAMEAEAERLVCWRAHENALTVAQATKALLQLGAAILDAYNDQKSRRALLDYDDLILLTRDLLRRPGLAPWVLFKLDGGLDHVLIDEAQDTNPDQWAVVEALTEEFFAGEGAALARGADPRTVFAVGDAKQSIYSFQRADPSAFARMREHFGQRVQEAQHGWEAVELYYSFRSTAAILGAVDAVFAQADARDGVLFGESALRHEPVRVGEAGRVELWPPAEHEDAAEEDPWELPGEPQDSGHPRERLARLIARRVQDWTAPGNAEGYLPAKGRQMRPGDVLVLVRRRNEFVDELVRALKQAGVPVAGIDRMVLTDQLAVRDLVALGRFLLLPSDDLTLACVLKGPLIDLGEERLFDLAHGREGRALWDVLRERAGEAGDFETAHAKLTDLLARVDYARPYELYAELLGRERGRERLLARLGSEAIEPIEEFLSLALSYERQQAPSLEGFLHWLEAGGQEIKRESEQGANAVRIMTVHGAKGLQAPVVFLPDTMQTPGGRTNAGDKLYWDQTKNLLFWPPRKELETEPVACLREAVEAERDQEYRRLLYVAMTRAEDRLYVCGWRAKKAEPEDCWYSLVERGLAELAEAVPFDCTGALPDGWSGTALRYDGSEAASVGRDEAPETHAEEVAALPLEHWALTPPRAEPSPPRPLAPSREAEDEPPVRSPLGHDGGTSFQRGRLIHRLLQSLPDLAAEARREAGARFLAGAARELDAAERDALLAETLAVIEDPAFAHLFGPQSRAEVPVVGLLDGAAGPRAISGQVDRLVLHEGAVMVVDYKTNRPPARTPAEVPAVYHRQLAAYRRLLEQVYPGRRVETWLLWTDGPTLMRVGEENTAA